MFTNPTPALDQVKKGSVLVAGMGSSTPRGLLRYVKSATRRSPALTLETADAPPQLAFRKLHVRASRTTPMLGNMQPGWPAPSVLSASAWLSPRSAAPGTVPQFDMGGVDFKKTLMFDFYPFDGDGDLKTTDDQVHAHAESSTAHSNTIWGSMSIGGRWRSCRRPPWYRRQLADGIFQRPSMPWTGSVLSYFAPSSIRELPTTGYLIAGRLQRYVIESSDPGLPAESSYPGLALTDDGGAMILTHATWQGGGDDSLWLFKAAARDGTLPFEASKASVASYSLQSASCAITAAGWAPSMSKVAPGVTARAVKVEAAALKTDAQIP